MLILTRRTDEYITIIDRESGRSFQIGIAELRGSAVRIGIDDRYDNFEVIRNELLPLTDPRRVENNPNNRTSVSCSGTEGETRCHEWKHTPDVRTTPIKCLLCEDPAAAIVYAPNGCACSPNKYQPRCYQHLQRAWDSGEDITVIEDFVIPNLDGPETA